MQFGGDNKELEKERIMIKLTKLLLVCMFMASLLAGCGTATLEVMNPRGEIAHPPYVAPNPRIEDLSGKKIGIYWNGKSGGNNLFDVLEGMLKEKYPTATIVRSRGTHQISDDMAAKLAKEVDTFIYGVGD